MERILRGIAHTVSQEWYPNLGVHHREHVAAGRRRPRPLESMQRIDEVVVMGMPSVRYVFGFRVAR